MRTGEDFSASGQMFFHPLRNAFGKDHIIRKNQQFVTFPRGIFRHQIELDLQFRQHPDGGFHSPPGWTAPVGFPEIHQRDLRLVHRIQHPFIILLNIVVNFPDTLENRQIKITPRMEMSADVRPHPVRRAVEQIVFQTLRRAQSAEIAPVVEASGHIHDFSVRPGNRPQIMRIDRQAFIAPHRSRQTFAFQMAFHPDHLFIGPSVEIQQGIRLDRMDKLIELGTQPPDRETPELHDRFRIIAVDSFFAHLPDTMRTDARLRCQTVEKETVDRIIFQQFPDHVLEMFPVRGIVADRPDAGRIESPQSVICLIRISPRGDPQPVGMVDQFFIAQMSIEIGAEFDSFPAAGLADGAEQVELQSRMPFPVTGIVIGVALIAAGVPGEEIHPAGFHLIGKRFRIECRPHVRNIRRGVEIVKKSVFELCHGGAFSCDLTAILFFGHCHVFNDGCPAERIEKQSHPTVRFDRIAEGMIFQFRS